MLIPLKHAHELLGSVLSARLRPGPMHAGPLGGICASQTYRAVWRGCKKGMRLCRGSAGLQVTLGAVLQTGKPVIVASQLLNSMIDVPVPTRAEVADCADAVRQQADALMLSAETAAGQYPVKSVETLRNVRPP